MNPGPMQELAKTQTSDRGRRRRRRRSAKRVAGYKGDGGMPVNSGDASVSERPGRVRVASAH